MKKINLTKYGFIRNPEKDKYEDGIYYRFYTHPKAPKSDICKIIENGKLCLYSELYSPHLTYEEFKEMPYPNIFNKLGDILVSDVTESDLKEFAKAVVEYEKEITKKVKKLVWPNLSVLDDALTQESYRFKRERIYAENMLKNNVDIIFNLNLLNDVKFFINRSKNFDINKTKQGLLKSRSRLLDYLKNEKDYSTPTTDFVNFQNKLRLAGFEVF